MATSEDVERVWREWAGRQQRPDLVRLTAERRKLIGARLRLGYSAEDLVALVRYAYEADEPGPRFWRGENESRRTYLDLENLLRVGKLGDRVPRARLWAEDDEPPDAPDGVLPLGRAAAASAPAPERVAGGVVGGTEKRWGSARRG